MQLELSGIVQLQNSVPGLAFPTVQLTDDYENSSMKI